MASPINLETIKNSKVTMPLVWVFVLFIAGWKGPDVLNEYLDNVFFTLAQADEHTAAVTKQIKSIGAAQVQSASQLNSHITEFRLMAAVQAVRAYQEDLAKHRATTNNGNGWIVRETALENKVELAKEYKNCILNDRPNCDLLQRQLWQ